MLTVLALLAATAQAVPMQLNHQGRIMDSITGVPLQGANSLTLTLYDSPTAGTALWSESRPAQVFTEGYYSAVMGQITVLDDSIFASSPVFLGIAVAGGPELPTRQEVVSVPYAFLANTATNVSGGVVNATEVQINGTPVIDASGNYIGTADGDTLAALSCFGGQVALYNGVAWACANAAADTTLTEAEVEFFVENGPLTLAAGTSLNGATISTGAHTLDTDTQLSEGQVESFITNGPINLFVGSLVDGVAISTGPHTADTNTQLTDAEVDAFVVNGALDFAGGSTLGGQVISTGAHTVDTTLTDAEVDAFVVNGMLNFAGGSTLGGQVISTGAHTIDTNTQLGELDVELFVTNGALDLNAGTTIGGLAISTGPHTVDTDTHLTDAEVDAFVVNGPLDLAAGSSMGGAAILTENSGGVTGSFQVGDTTAVCGAPEVGTLRWNLDRLQVCTVAGWTTISSGADGSSAGSSAVSCKQIQANFPLSSDGNYWIDPDGGVTSNAFEVYCDMTTDGGGWIRLADIGETTVFLDGASYANGLNDITALSYIHACPQFVGFDENTNVRLTMGAVVDYFKPVVGSDVCSMLQSFTQHRWSASLGGVYVVPTYYPTHLGGSAVGWPTDGRAYLSFWGGNGALSGCCTSSYGGGAVWNQTFTIDVREP